MRESTSWTFRIMAAQLFEGMGLSSSSSIWRGIEIGFAVRTFRLAWQGGQKVALTRQEN